jgi:hypothetical protein
MKKVSLLARCTIVIMLVTLVLASFPTANVLAKGNNQNLENKWDQLVTNYNRQSTTHNSVHNWVDHWFKTQKKASLSDKAEIRKHLVICNSAMASAGSVVATHAGFDAQGNVVDKGQARKSIKDLAYYLQQHTGSVKNLKEHLD